MLTLIHRGYVRLGAHGASKLVCCVAQFKEIAERRGNPLTISRAEMQEAIAAVGIVESDAEVCSVSV